MAYQKLNTVDYFPHSVHNGRKMFIVRNKFGNDGYAVWFMLLEEIGQAHNHYLDLSEDTQIMYLSAKFMVPEETFLSIVNTLVDLSVFDQLLWTKRVVYSHKFIESVADVYKRRKTELLTYEDLCKKLGCMQNSEKCIHNSENGIHDVDENTKNVDGIQQSKVNESKVEESREEEKEENSTSLKDYSPAEKALQKVREIGKYEPLAKSSLELFRLIENRAREDPEWWKKIAEYAKIEALTKDEREDSVKQWANYTFRDKKQDLLSWEKVEASIQYWLIRERQRATKA